MFTDNELAYLRQHRIGRLATANAKGQPRVVPTGFHVDAHGQAIEIGSHPLPGRGQDRVYTQNIAANPKVAFVVDDLASTDPWTPRGVTIGRRAELVEQGGERLGPGFGPKWIRITPEFISSWGIDTSPFEPPQSRRIAG